MHEPLLFCTELSFYQIFGIHANIIIIRIIAEHTIFAIQTKGVTAHSASVCIMNGMNFAKGVGVGIVVGSTIGMAVASSANSQKKYPKKNNVVGKALRAMGDIVDNIGDSIGM